MNTDWEPIPRDQYLVMSDRHRPLWAAIHDFIRVNKVNSVLEAGCGVAELAHSVNYYIGVDMNRKVLEENEAFYTGKSRWIHADWHDLDVTQLSVDMFVAASLIEHCDTYGPFLTQVCRVSGLKYAVITFHKGLRESSRRQLQSWNRNGQSGTWFNNYYSKSEVEQWLMENINDAQWMIYMIPHSRSARWRQRRWDSVLVLDWTWTANLDAWDRREINGIC